MKFKKRSKIVAAALAMMTLSTAAAITGTVAWFTANNAVTAGNMTVTAQAEQGIVIGAYTGAAQNVAPATSAFKESVDAYNASQTLLPTWTDDASVWYHSNSKESSDGQVYVDDGYAAVTNDESHNYYLFNKFQIKATGSETPDIYVKEITISGGTQDYDEAIRILVKSSSYSLVFAPISSVENDHTGSETILAATSTTDDLTADKTFSFKTVNTLASKILDDVNNTPSDVSIYIYYDGEDEVCNSDNIPVTPDLFTPTTLGVKFTSVTPNA